MKKIISFVMVLFVSSLVYAAPQQENSKASEPSQIYQKEIKKDFDKLIKELKITDEQKEKMKELMESDLSKRREYRRKIRERMELINDELAKEKYDESVIENLAKEIDELTVEMSRVSIDGKIKVRNILTFEQYTKMEQNRKKIEKKLKNKRANREKSK